MVYKVTTEYFQEDPAKIGNFHARSRDLWNDYVWRNRSHIVSVLADLPDWSANREWTKANVSDLTSVINDYFGTEAARRLDDVMTNMTTDMIQLLDYIKRPPNNFSISSDKFVSDMTESFKNNVDNLFNLLASLNPSFWNTQTLKNLFTMMSEYWISQLQMRVIKNWNEDLNAADKTFDMAREISYIFADGIVKQFPEKFAMS